MIKCFDLVRVECNGVGLGSGHKIYFFQVWSGSEQKIKGYYEVPKTLPAGLVCTSDEAKK